MKIAVFGVEGSQVVSVGETSGVEPLVVDEEH
jgi:hypothetical protein